MKKRLWVLGILLSMTVACQSHPMEKEATPAGSRLAPPTVRHTPTFPPLETNTPNPTGAIPSTLTPRSTSFAPRQVGGPNTGFSITVPGTWIQTGDLLNATQRETLGMQRLFFADSKNTATAALAGEPLSNGAYVLAYVGQMRVENDPVDELRAFLQTSGLPNIGPRTFQTNNGQQGAFVDLGVDPLGLFPRPPEPTRWRLVLLIQPESNAPAFYHFVTTAENWEAHRPLFDEIMKTIAVYKPPETFPGFGLPANVQGGLQARDMVANVLVAGMLDVWTFEAATGQYATITLFPREEHLDLTFSLITPSGQTVSNSDIGYAGHTETQTDIYLEEPGEYLIVVKEFFGASGRYQLSLSVTDAPQFGTGGPIEIGQVLLSELGGAQKQIWTFEGSAGQVVSIILSPSQESFDGILELRDPTGTVLISLDEGFSGDAEVISNLTLPLTGQYTVHVAGFGGNGGPYTLSLAEGVDETTNFYDAGDLLYAQSREESLRSNEAHAWFFNGRQGDEVEIVVTPLRSDLDLHVWLLSPETERLAERDEFIAGRPEQIVYTLPEDGQFIILVREFTGQPGNYEIALSLRENSTAVYSGVISYGQTLEGTIAEGRDHAWYFPAVTGERVNLALTPLTEAGLTFLLLDPAGNVVASLDASQQGEAARLPIYEITEDGTWSIVIRSPQAATNSYQLSLQLVE